MFSRLRILALLAAGPSASPLHRLDVFRAGDNGYDSYRIPALIVSPKGTLLAFCEGRRNSASDTGDIDVLLRRSLRYCTSTKHANAGEYWVFQKEPPRNHNGSYACCACHPGLAGTI